MFMDPACLTNASSTFLNACRYWFGNFSTIMFSTSDQQKLTHKEYRIVSVSIKFGRT
ncbi:hypothetical protein HMPREF1979_00035 [Actinomyces johnsonii F0542]|uniref:Uncharacterized protein n=1 Tax=Actinomyces johnsonii F0542 TaxID=1321818 RepID=U1QVJ8_9ACTO|nr:hypothetical protein HMPREF1979_00035 [Actinomyces johnsonii F0542]